MFAFLWDPSVDATNWRAEHAIRPAVVTPKGLRRQSHSSRRRHPAVLASVVRTAHQRQLDLTALLATVLRATHPVVPHGLQRPPL